MSPQNSTTVVNPREQRGLRIAERHRLRPKGDVWIVPSESNGGPYRVDPSAGRCTCPDSEVRRVKCKHQWAVEITIRRETTRTEETVTVNGTVTTKVAETTRTVKRVTYLQDWPSYNAAQTTEKQHFMELLADLCRGIPEPARTNGRPRLPLADMVYSVAFKVYAGMSGRRFMTDLSDAHARGYVASLPHFNTVFNTWRCRPSRRSCAT
jgi:SWIM zinc finger